MDGSRRTEAHTAPVALADSPTIDHIAIPELGNTGYLITSGDQAVAIDVPRAVDRYLEVAAIRATTITHVLDTHVHNDFVSGARELRARSGATIGAARRGRYGFAHRELGEGDEIRIGDVRIVAIETPGHTPEHLSFLVYGKGSDVPEAVLTGGSLLVGTAGRSDLLGPELADELNRAQFASLGRLVSLPGTVRVLPTHGAGSFCVPVGGTAWERTSTVEQERISNPLLAISNVQEFLVARGTGLPPIPAYYPAVGPINRRGPSSTPPAPPIPIEPARAAALVDEGAWILDTRERLAFCAAHIPGSVNVELDGSLPGRLGSVVPFGTPLVLVVEPADHASIEQATVSLARVGFDRLLGLVDGGVEAWRASGQPVASIRAATPDDLWDALHTPGPPLVLDVRMPIEWEEGMGVNDALRIHFGDLPARIAELPRDREIWTICSAGKRATIAASLLQREGLTARPVATGGVLDLLERQVDEAER